MGTQYAFRDLWAIRLVLLLFLDAKALAEELARAGAERRAGPVLEVVVVFGHPTTAVVHAWRRHCYRGW